MSAFLMVSDPVRVEIDGRVSMHCVVARKTTALTRTGVAYRLLPAVTPEWIDADQVMLASGFDRWDENGADPFSEAVA